MCNTLPIGNRVASTPAGIRIASSAAHLTTKNDYLPLRDCMLGSLEIDSGVSRRLLVTGTPAQPS